MKKLIISLAFALFIGNAANSQSNYNQELEKGAKEISQKIISSGKNNVAVLDFENSNKQISELGSWLASVFTTHLENNNGNKFAVKNRTDIEKAIQQIKSESGSGAYDTKTIQRLGEISGSDVIVYGEITLMDNEITVNIRTKNISLNESIGGVLVSFIATDGMRTKYDNYLESKSSSPVASSGASGEGTAKSSKDPNCKENNSGDYCFQNNTKFSLEITFFAKEAKNYSYSRGLKCTLQPGQKQCFYDLQSGSATYNIVSWKGGSSPAFYTKSDMDYNAKGTLYIDVCKEKTFIIK